MKFQKNDPTVTRKLPSWNRRGGPKGRGGREIEMAPFQSHFRLNSDVKPGIVATEARRKVFVDLATTPALRATPPVPGG